MLINFKKDSICNINSNLDYNFYKSHNLHNQRSNVSLSKINITGGEINSGNIR